MIADICPSYVVFSQSSTASGPDAYLVREALKEIARGFDESTYLTGNSQTAIAELFALAAKAKEDDWDGEGGSKMSPDSFNLAHKLLRGMPRDLSAPDVDVDPDGEVSFQWYTGPGKRLSVSVGASGSLSYAWMVPNDDGNIERNYGVAESKGLFPETVSMALSKLGA